MEDGFFFCPINFFWHEDFKKSIIFTVSEHNYMDMPPPTQLSIFRRPSLVHQQGGRAAIWNENTKI